MFGHYLKAAFRHIRRHKGYAFINMAGLALGMACCVLTFLYVRYELNYDRVYKKADRIFRVVYASPSGQTFIPTELPLAPALREECPGVETATTVANFDPALVYKDMSFWEQRSAAVDPHFFDVFSFLLIKGDPRTALSEPNTVVLSKSTAVKYFGSEDPINNVLLMKWHGRETLCRVTAVMEDMPQNLHFHFDVLFSIKTMGWDLTNWSQGSWVKTYLVLKDNFPQERMAGPLTGLLRKHIFTQSGQLPREYKLQPLGDIHLHSHGFGEFEQNGDITYIYVFAMVGLLVLLISCVNFINLATARSARRAKEVGLRKVVGSKKSQLIKQFIGESVQLSLISLFLTLILVKISLPFLRKLSGRPIDLHYFDNPYVLPLLIGAALVIGILAGIYPAFILSSFKPVSVLKGSVGTGKRARFFSLRNVLVVFQFVFSVSLMFCIVIIYGQLNYIRNSKLGFSGKNVVVLQNFGLTNSQNDRLKTELLINPSVTHVGGSSVLPGQIVDDKFIFNIEGVDNTQDAPSLYLMKCDYDFLEALEMEMGEGRFFSREHQTDASAAIVNEEVIQKSGLSDPIGKNIMIGGLRLHIIGVIRNFHYKSLHEEMPMLALKLFSGGSDEFPPRRFMAIRIKGEQIPETLAFIKNTWDRIAQGMPYAYSFLDESLGYWYNNERRAGQVAVVFCGLAVFVSCLGLFGLASFAAERKKKEIGIRKVLGASVSQVSELLFREYIQLIVVSVFLSWPLSFIVMKNWLQKFAYRTGIGPWPFILSGTAALLITGLTVSYQVIKAAVTNPLPSLRNE